jgi:hypothetical protein
MRAVQGGAKAPLCQFTGIPLLPFVRGISSRGRTGQLLTIERKVALLASYACRPCAGNTRRKSHRNSVCPNKTASSTTTCHHVSSPCPPCPQRHPWLQMMPELFLKTHRIRGASWPLLSRFVLAWRHCLLGVSRKSTVKGLLDFVWFQVAYKLSDQSFSREAQHLGYGCNRRCRRGTDLARQ